MPVTHGRGVAVGMLHGGDHDTNAKDKIQRPILVGKQDCNIKCVLVSYVLSKSRVAPTMTANTAEDTMQEKNTHTDDQHRTKQCRHKDS
jgi:hypothetical protein